MMVTGTMPVRSTTGVNVFGSDQKWEILYNVIVVNKTRAIILDKKVVAKNEESAKFEAGVYELLKELSLSLNDATIICNYIGTVIVEKE